MRNGYLLALCVLVVLLLAGCADLVQYDKGYRKLDEVSTKLPAADMETHDAMLPNEDELSDLKTATSPDENIVKNTRPYSLFEISSQTITTMMGETKL